MEFFNRIVENTNQLSKSDNEILSYCIRNSATVSHMKVQEVAAALYTSPASIIRFCKKIGFSGFSEFKAQLRMETRQEETARKSQIRSIDFLKDIHKTTQLIQEDTIEQILELIHTKERIELYAVGSSRMVANEFAKRLQLQERLTAQIADAFMENLHPKGVMVMIEGEHTCMTMRGIKKPGSKTVTVTTRGVFAEDEKLQNTFFRMVER